MTNAELTILELLDEGGEWYGLDLVKRSNGRLQRGVVYVWLQRLEEQELVTSRVEDDTDPRIGAPRRLYRITPKGSRKRVEASAVLWKPVKT